MNMVDTEIAMEYATVLIKETVASNVSQASGKSRNRDMLV